MRNNSLTLTTVVAMLLNLVGAGLAPLPAAAAPASGYAFASLGALPSWFTGVPALADAHHAALPAWFGTGHEQPATSMEHLASRVERPAPSAGHPASGVLPAWFSPASRQPDSTSQHPAPGPVLRDIPLSLLTVDVTGAGVASLGSPLGSGDLYTAVIRNSSSDTAYGLYLTATHPAFFVHDGGDQIISRTGTIPFNLATSTTAITWTPVTTYNLVPGETITLNFKLRAACTAQSGQRLEVGVRYNADPSPATPVELNSTGLNVTTGRGNLVIKKEPAFQYLGTPDFGKPITWTVTVQNTGLGLLYDAIVTDTGGISLSQPSGDLVPTATIPVLDINESRVFTVVGTVEACNFTNVALASWTCGNLVGDATAENPVSSTVSVYFTPQVPKINVQVSSPITFPYCDSVTRTVVITINSTGGPAANFRLDSTFESDGFLEVITPSISGDWQYNPSNGYFSYLGGSPSGTIPGAGAGAPVTLTFQVRPQLSYICGAGSGDVIFTPLYNDVCTDAPFTGNPAQLAYQYAQGEAPTLSISKSGPGVVASGDVFTYLVTVSGQNPHNISGAVNVTDVLPSEFELRGYAPSTGTVTPAGQTVVWSFDPPDSPATFSEILVITAQVVITEDICGASQIVDNDVEAFAIPTCPACSPLNPSAQVNTAIENNEGIFPDNGYFGSDEVCGDGYTIVNRYLVTGSYVVTWTGAVFTEALGTPIGDGALTGTITYLMYQADSLSVTVNGVDYTSVVTPVTSTDQLVIDLSPLQAAGAPTQNLTLMITYTVAISEGSLSGFVERTFHDWSQLYLPNFSDVEGCAANNSFNQVLLLTIGRGDLSLGLAPRILDRCSTNPVILTVNDNAPGRLTDHIVVTFTSSSSEIRSARNFTTTGLLPDISSIAIVSDADIGAGVGIITFTFPAAFDPNGDGEIRFEVDANCVDESPWNAGIIFESRCDFPHGDTTSLTHVYRTPNLLLFATPVRIPLRERDVDWIFFVTNNGNLTATNVVVTNTVESLAVFTYTPDGPGVALSGTLPITSSDVVFTISEIEPGVQRAVTVTARAIQCEPLYVTIRADLECFDKPCAQPQAEIPFDVPRPYLLTNNGETADLPMCDIGEVIFTTKNASSDVSLYNVDITETLRGLAPAAGEPITVTIVDDEDNVVASTTTFTPEVSTLLTETVLVWKAISATTEVVTWFQALPPLYVIRIFVPVRTYCIPPNVPESFAAASAQGPCGQHLGYTEDAFTLQTLQPDMDLEKDGRVAGGVFTETIYAVPGETVTWRIRAYNYPSSRSYVAESVVLSDTWPVNFEFITASVSSTQAITAHLITATRTITWDVGNMAPQWDPLEFFITGTIAITEDACVSSTINSARLYYGCDELGCTSSSQPLDTADLDARPDVTVELHPDPLPTCEGDIPITIRNYGARAYSTTLTVTLPGGYVYSHTVSSGLLPTEIITSPTTAPRFKWDVIPGRLGPDSPPYAFTLVLRVENSGSGGEACPSAHGKPVTATFEYDDHLICTDSGPFIATHSVSLSVLTPTLQVEKLPRSQTVDVGESITWTIRVTNTGNVIAENVLITDVVASNFTNVTATVGSDGSPPTVVTTTNTITWTPGDISPGGVWTAAVSAVLLESGVNRNVVTATAYCATGCQTAVATDTAYATLLQNFDKSPPIQTGTIGSLVVFTLSTFLSDEDALYQDLTLTDTLPTGLGYVDSVLTYTYDMDAVPVGPVISNTPTINPGWLASGDVVWALGDLSGTVQIRGVLTAVIQDDPVCYDGARLTNDLRMTYTDDGQPYVYTDTTDVDVQEPILHIGKTYVTPYGCDATLFQDNFNDNDANGWTPYGGGGWSVVDGVYRQTSDGTNRRSIHSATWDDYSFSAMIRSSGDNDSIGLLFRVQNATQYYRLMWNRQSSYWRLHVLTPTTRLLASDESSAYDENRWYHLEIRVEGDRLRGWIDGGQIFDVTDATFARGGVGLYASSENAAEFDDILVTRFGDMACTVGANDLVTYTLVVSNQARITGYDLVITDSIPDGMSFYTYTMTSDDPASTVTAWPVLGETGDLVWNITQLEARSPFDPLNHTALTLTVVLAVSDGITANITLPNQTWLFHDNWPGSSQPVGVDRDYSGGSHSTAVRTVRPGIDKDVTPPTATLGDVITYTILVPAQPISATIYDVAVTDWLDSRLMLQSVTDGPDGTVIVGANSFTVTYPVITSTLQRVITFTAILSSPLGASAGNLIPNQAVLSHATDITYSDQPDFRVTEPALSILKVSDPPTSSTVEAGDSVTYTVRIINGSGINVSAAYDLVFTDTLPAGMRDATPSLITVTLNGAPVSASDYVTGYNSATGVFTITFIPDFSIPVGGVLLIEYVAALDVDVAAGLHPTNLAEVTWSSLPAAVPGDRDYGPESDTTTVHTPIATDLSKVGGPPTVTIGSRVFFTVTVPDPPIGAVLLNVIVTDVVDSRLAIESVSSNASYSGQVVTAFFASIPTYTQQIIRITAAVRDLITVTAGTQITNNAVFDYAGNPTGTIESEVVTVTVVEPALTLVKASDPPTSSTVGSGYSVTYTVAITNAAWVTASLAHDIVFTDTLPTYMRDAAPLLITVTLDGAVVDSGDYTTGYDSATGVFTVAFTSAFSIPPGGELVIQYVALVDSDVPAREDLTNQAQVAWSSLPGPVTGERDYGPLGDSTTVHAGIPALDLEKSATPSPVQAGDNLTYTLTVVNTGIVSATGVVISDVIPLNTTFVTATLPHTGPVPGPAAGSVISWYLGTLHINAPRTVTMVVQVASPLISGTLITNTAWVTSSEGISDTDQITTPVTSWHELVITKTAVPSVVQPGEVLTYTLDWSVSGNEPAYGVTISDTVPANTTFITATLPVTVSGALLTWPLGDHNPGDSGYVTFTVQVDSPLISGTLLYNAALITDTQGVTDTDEITTPVTSWHDLVITKTAAPSPVEAGALLTYTLAWEVVGNEPSLDTTISDTTPVSTTFWAASPPTATTPAIGGTGPVIWSLGDQNPPASGVVTMVVRVDSPILTGTLLYNVVLISDTQGVTDTDEITTPVTSWHDLVITKTAVPSPVRAGDLLTYTLAWEVVGNEPSLDTTISDTTPMSTTFWAASPPTATTPAVGGTGPVIWALGDQNPPASGVVTMVVRVDTPLLTDTVLYNAVLITDTQGISDTDEITTLVRSWHTLTVTKAAEPSPVAAGALLTYTLEWQVAGNEPSLDTTISDTTPVSTTFWAASPPTATTPAVGGTGTVVWYLGNQYPPAVGAVTGVVTMVVRVDSTAVSGTLLYNAAVITDSQGISDTDDITTPVGTWADVMVVKADDPDPVIVGTLLTYTLVVTNNGPSDAHDVVVTDRLPPEVSFITATTPVTVALPDLAWPLGTLVPGAVRRLTVTVQVLVTTTVVFTNSSVVTTTTPEDNPGNNDDDESTTPLAPGLEILKTVAPARAACNMPFTYTLRINNTGQVTFDPLRVTDTLPADFYYVVGSGSPSDPDVIAEPLLVWQNLGPLAPAASITVTFAVTASPGITGTYVNVATTTGTTPGGTITDTDDAPVDIEQPAVEVDKQVVGIDRDEVAPNYVTFTIAITNVGPTVIDVLPLVDQYDNYYLSFTAATPYPEQDADDGLITWNDLTGPAPNGFGRNLGLGERFLVTTVFRVAHDITITTTNVATTTNAVDDYDNPAEDDDDEEDIGGEDQPDIPTPIEILYFRAVAEEAAVRLEWATIAELGTVGFYVYRAPSASFGDAQAIVYVPATGPGSTYSHMDRDVTPGQPYWYWLVEDVVGDEPDTYGPVRSGVGIDSLPHRLYLPLMQKGWGEQGATSRPHGSGLRMGFAARLCRRWWR